MQSPQPNSLQFYGGNDLTFILPSGHEVTIREQNGDDDETLSKLNPDKREEMLANLNAFVATIIKENTMNGGKYLDLEGVNKLKLKDKYYILLKSRLHSIGSELKFSAACRNKECQKTTKFKEDLNQYDTDLSKYDGAKDKYKYQIVPYPNGKDMLTEFVLRSGKKVRFTPMTVEAESKTNGLETISDNTDLYLRNLELYDNQSQEWIMLGSFGIFSKPDMIEIKAKINELDDQFMMFMELQCPHCKTKWEVPFLYLKDFFFPAEL